MVARGDDACGKVDEALAPQERGEAFAGVDAAAVQVGVAGGEPAQLHAGADVAESGDAAGQDGVEPHGAGGDALEEPRVELALEACNGAADAKP